MPQSLFPKSQVNSHLPAPQLWVSHGERVGMTWDSSDQVFLWTRFGEKAEVDNREKGSLRNSAAQQHYLCVALSLEPPASPHGESSPRLFLYMGEGADPSHFCSMHGTVIESSVG